MAHYALMGDGRMIDGEQYEKQRGTDDYLKEHPEYQRYDFISEGDIPSFLYLSTVAYAALNIHPMEDGAAGLLRISMVFTVIPPLITILIRNSMRHSIPFPAGSRIFRMTLPQESSED